MKPSPRTRSYLIAAGRAVFGDLPVEIRNEARVHLWYEAKFGVP